ncbi:MAG: hypothetical protein ACRETL_09945, partial [Gammaproteobacteria bacterium]
MRSDETREELLDRWARPLGRFLLAMGEIEHVTNDFLGSFVVPETSPRRLPTLRERVMKMRSALVQRSDLCAAAPSLTADLDAVVPLLAQRNF